MMPTYTKPYLTLPDQLNLVKTRGLQVADDAAAIDCLHRNGYYRLSAYWYPFRKIVVNQRTHDFLPNSHFEDAVALYWFDKAFKLVLLDALERVEVAVRAEIALRLGQRDPFAHENPRLFHPNFTSRISPSGQTGYINWIDKFHEHVRRSSDAFILHHRNKYGSNAPLPIWIAIELWDFGLLSHAFSGMRNPDQVAVSASFAVPNWRLIQSWLRSLNYVRNVIAHHGRLWNVNLSVNPLLPRRGEITEFDDLIRLNNPESRIYSICCILCYLTRVINPQSTWIQDLKTFVNAFPSMPYASIQDMGFPANWQTHRFWV